MSLPPEQIDPFTSKFGVKPRQRVKGKAQSAIRVRPPSTGPPAVEMPLTISVVEAARRLGIGRNSAERMLDAAIPENEAAE
jgi:hypothetical protein